MPPVQGETVQADFYDLPSVYDILHQPGTADELDGLERIARDHVRTRSRSRSQRWLEPACGSGRHVRLAARRGTRVTGVDLSAPMLDYCRARLKAHGPAVTRRAKLIQANITDIHAHTGENAFDFAFCLINSVRHLPTDAAMRTHLQSVRKALKPGGVYAVGLNFGGLLRGQPLEFHSEDVWHARRGRVRVRQVVQYETPQEPGPGARTEHVYSVLTVHRGAQPPQMIESRYELRTFNRAQWFRVCAQAGFEHAASVDEDGHEIPVGEAGYGIHLLRKPV